MREGEKRDRGEEGRGNVTDGAYNEHLISQRETGSKTRTRKQTNMKYKRRASRVAVYGEDRKGGDGGIASGMQTEKRDSQMARLYSEERECMENIFNECLGYGLKGHTGHRRVTKLKHADKKTITRNKRNLTRGADYDGQ